MGGWVGGCTLRLKLGEEISKVFGERENKYISTAVTESSKVD